MLELDRPQAELALPSRASRLKKADEICRQKGIKLTPLRRSVLESLVDADAPLGAYELAERVSGSGRKIFAVSIYRALDVLTTVGLVHRISARNAYLARDGEDRPGEAVVFLICRSCGHVGETASSEVEHGIDHALATTGFRPSGRVLEIEGECAACQA